MEFSSAVDVVDSSFGVLTVRVNATAVPVMVGQFLNADGNVQRIRKGCTRIDNWQDFSTKFSSGAAVVTITVGSPRTSEGSDPSPFQITSDVVAYPAALSLRHYFDNGGGPCYVLSYATHEETSYIAAEIARHPDISLLVLAEPAPAPVTRASVHAQFELSLKDDKGRFVIASGEDAGDVTLPSMTEDQVGFYYPFLHVPYKHHRDDQAVRITAYRDGSESENVVPEITRLSQLADKHPGLYEQICAALDTALASIAVPPIPPGPAVAGAYCHTDQQRGVWKAPANFPLRKVISLTTKVSDKIHGELSEKGINVIRAFNSRSAVIYGAKTLVKTMDWLYIPVRRLFGAVERDIRNALPAVTLASGDTASWEQTRAAIDNYLYALWQKGALLGKSPDEAYFIKLGETNVTQEGTARRDGMCIQVGMAAVRPAEFMTLEFTPDAGSIASIR